MPGSVIRQRCFVTIAQDPFVLDQASLRFNLDVSSYRPRDSASLTSIAQPSSILSDEQIVASLQRTRLWSHFQLNHASQHPTSIRRALNKPLASLPRLSQGQMQLFALARALLQLQHRRQRGAKPIVLLDEIASSLDAETEAVVQRIIHEEFAEMGHTVLAITHDLNSVARNVRKGREWVAVMDKGEVARFDVAEMVLDAMTTTEQR